MEQQEEAVKILQGLRQQDPDCWSTILYRLLIAILKQFPLDARKSINALWKIFRMNGTTWKLQPSIAAMGHSLRLTVAEGVETARTADFEQQGCDYYQGYLCCPPTAGKMSSQQNAAANNINHNRSAQ